MWSSEFPSLWSPNGKTRSSDAANGFGVACGSLHGRREKAAASSEVAWRWRAGIPQDDLGRQDRLPSFLATVAKA